jgi:hypothetical protein
MHPLAAAIMWMVLGVVFLGSIGRLVERGLGIKRGKR